MKNMLAVVVASITSGLNVAEEKTCEKKQINVMKNIVEACIV